MRRSSSGKRQAYFIRNFHFAAPVIILRLLKKLLPAFIFSLCFHFIHTAHLVVVAQNPSAATRAKSGTQRANAARDREIAAHFAPVFYQGLGDKKRHDYITNFDFDNDWRGDNNWNNSADERFPLRAFVYYAVSETPTHILVHYAVFHPRDYKGGAGARGTILSEIIREGVRRGGRYDPTGLSSEAVLAHENDMEGCLVVAAKAGADFKGSRVMFVETLAHDRFLKYTTEPAHADGSRRAFDFVRLEAGHAELYVEPKGHGIVAYVGGERQSPANGTLVYKFTGRADDPDKSPLNATGYDLLPLYTTIWPRARGGVNQTFGAAYKYGARAFGVAQTQSRAVKRSVNLGTLGSAFRGSMGAPNIARPPWGWFDRNEREQAHGEWFFDPAATIKRHFKLGGDFSVAYTHAPFLSIFRKL